MKNCVKCKEDRPLSEYNPKGSSLTGTKLRDICMFCEDKAKYSVAELRERQVIARNREGLSMSWRSA